MFQLDSRFKILNPASAFVLLLLAFMHFNMSALAASSEVAKKRPNILFILADDHRADLLGKIHPIIKTPNLDELADKGTMFKNAFVTTPICASSRVSILTGLTERTHDFTFGRPATGLVESNNMYPKLLKESGYRSGFVGKYEIKFSNQDHQNFDYFKPLLQSKTNEFKGKTIPQTYYITELAKEFITQSNNTQQPWAISVNYWNPHAHDTDEQDQYHYPEEFESWYADVEIPAAKFSDDANFDNLPEFLRNSIGRVRWQYRYADEAMYQKMVKRHYRAISAVDKGVGMILKMLEETGQADNTIVIYTGDNGYNINERQLAGKWFGWEEDLRVPLIIYDPRNKSSQGKVKQQMALNIDIAPTILNLANVNIPASYQGLSLNPLMTVQDPLEWRKEFFFEHMYQPKRVSIPPMVGIRTTEWKYVEFYKNDFKQLYDLKADPAEQTNLAESAKYQSILQEFERRTGEYIERYEDQRTEEVKARPSFVNTRDTLK
ncbi:MAG: sulfatase-like hydrolase/transferase [Paraglaciecola sp.]|nr:sulfatase-like hydrolase/transferase [Paraglaciecola sp.]